MATNSDPNASIDDLTPGCEALDPLGRLTTTYDFTPAVPDTLADWNLEGRWFYTDPVRGVSSVYLERVGKRVRVDHDDRLTVSVNDTELFARFQLEDEDGPVIVAHRISNLRPDGTLRAERATCRAGRCEMCVSKLVRATRYQDEGESQGLRLLGELHDPSWGPGYTFNVRVAGTLAYLIRQDGLHIIETADPAHPVELGVYHRSELGYSNDVKLVDAGARRYALIADSPIDIVDVTDPAQPGLVAQIPEAAHTLFTETRDGRTRAYVGSLDGNCPVYDVTDPTRPAKLGSYPAGASLVHDLSVADGIAYLNAWEQGFLVVDFQTPATPTLLGAWRPTPAGTSHSSWTTRVAGRHIALHGDEGYNAHLDIVDVDPASPTFMASIASWQTRPWISIHNLMVFGSKAYFSHYQDGIRVLDLADPRAPAQLGYFNTWDPQSPTVTSAFYEGAVGLDVDVARKLVFVADSPRGLLILADETP